MEKGGFATREQAVEAAIVHVTSTVSPMDAETREILWQPMKAQGWAVYVEM